MIILQVAMGHGFLKKTVKEINTTLVFVKPATVMISAKSQGSQIMIYKIEGSTCGPGTSATGSGTSVNENIGTVGNV
jgi:hypothetical protein